MRYYDFMPMLDKSFSLEEALKDLGFSIDEKNDGRCYAKGMSYDVYGEIIISFYFSAITNVQCEMMIAAYPPDTQQQEILFSGIAPQNQRDFDLLMQLIFPSPDFKNKIESEYINHFL